ncbi:unnamed protein product [Zymoseptoria tritici ST99CH_3D1]|nr:unnamed protein product [Zymoseptoria tritici ST99CH_3D1]
MKLFFLTIGLFLAAAMAAPTADPARTPDQPPPGGRLIKPFTCAPGVPYYNLCDRGSKQVRCTVTCESQGPNRDYWYGHCSGGAPNYCV